MPKFYSFIFILCSYFVFSQEYQPLLVEGNRWQVSFRASLQNYNCFDFQGGSSYNYRIIGDSVVNGKSYKKIYFNFTIPRPDNKRSCYGSPISDTKAYLATLLREDILDKKVYRNINGTNEETLLYDFSLNTGNTIPHLGYDFDQDPTGTVTSIVTGSVFEKTIKVFKTKVQGMNTDYNYPGYAIYEGIGSSNGLLEFPSVQPFEYGHWLDCFENSSGISCNSFLANSESVFKSSNPKLYFSKADKSFKVISPDNKNVNVEFFDSSGQLIKKVDTKTNQSFYLNRDFKGLLLYKITDGKMYSGKIILE